MTKLSGEVKNPPAVRKSKREGEGRDWAVWGSQETKRCGQQV